MSKKRVFSGIQPTGVMTIGNYIGAVSNWVSLQAENDCVFSIVDLHSMTTSEDPASFRSRCFDFMALFLACGIDPGKSIVFFQSHVSSHAELAWLLGCFTYTGELNRMTQFKDKSKKNPANINAGLYTYPVLMAADILLYDTDLVPVGDDQRQHVELARDIALRFNNRFGPVFTVPEALVIKSRGRIKKLLDPSQKMDKSDQNERNYISLIDGPEAISRKIKGAVTGSGRDYPVKDDNSGIFNLMTIMSSVRNVSIEEISAEYSGKGYSAFKNDLIGSINAMLEPLRRSYKEYRHDESYLLKIAREGAIKASTRAVKTLKSAYEKVGLII
jgi:tryptophanyl-tRNA synthetase